MTAGVKAILSQPGIASVLFQQASFGAPRHRAEWLAKITGGGVLLLPGRIFITNNFRCPESCAKQSGAICWPWRVRSNMASNCSANLDRSDLGGISRADTVR